ncbi:unnamed protein product [Diatraea saccharalis]|uniref:Uncharacterized protein n=1 Tax=Diatraea saccharalis TaxID=40085 RepID=A0A9N9WIJ1_9NEOP|nr:unnamed protein product [Diatraea saccharalis]
MPSLVSLQLMRNRLHLAYLGRKLMKWSALATGRELRSIAMTLDSVYKSFGEDLQNAYMLLARARYFCPFMNKMVIENIDNQSGVEPYEHLGIEKGGQQIHEAKVAWLELLKRLILIVELRVSFKLLEISNLSATKRQKVLEKLVAPRTIMTIRYITDELEEKAREDFFRLKKTMQIKRKLALAAAKLQANGLSKSQTSIVLTETSIPEILEDDVIQEIKEDLLTDTNIQEEIKEDLLTDTNNQEEVKEDSIKSPKEDIIPSNNIEKISKTNSEITSKPMYSVESIRSEKVIKNLSTRPSRENMNKEVERENISCLEICDSCRDHLKQESLITKENDTDTKTDLELGVWETEYEEIIKIVRVQKEDGTIVEEKKVIKKRKENRIPIDQLNVDKDIDESTSSKSTHFSGSQTIGTVTVKNKSAFSVKRNAISETIMCLPKMTNPIIRYCLSTACTKSTNDTYDFYCVSLFQSREDIISSDKSYASSIELEVILNNYTTTSAISSTFDSINSSVTH